MTTIKRLMVSTPQGDAGVLDRALFETAWVTTPKNS